MENKYNELIEQLEEIRETSEEIKNYYKKTFKNVIRIANNLPMGKLRNDILKYNGEVVSHVNELEGYLKSLKMLIESLNK